MLDLDPEPNEPHPLGDAGAKLTVHVEVVEALTVCLSQGAFVCDAFLYNLKYAPIKY